MSNFKFKNVEKCKEKAFNWMLLERSLCINSKYINPQRISSTISK